MESAATLVDLPDELLAAIATLGIQSQESPASNTSNERCNPNFAILFSHICARTRAVTLNTPLLWSHPRLRTGPHRHCTQQLDAFLERSNPCGVNLSLDFVGLPSGTHNKFVTETCEIVKRHANRWEHINITDDWGVCLPVLLLILKDVKAPELLSLKLTLTNYPWRLGVPFTPFLPGGAPRLRILSLTDSPLPWSDITTFPELRTLNIFYSSSGYEPTVDTLRIVLKSLPRLSSLSLRAYSGPSFQSIPGNNDHMPELLIHMPSLTALELSLQRKDSVVGILSMIRAPRLRGLTLGHTTPEDLARLSAGMLPPLPALTHLYVAHSVCERGSFSFVRMLPSLRSLLCVGRTSDLLCALGTAGRKCPCPELETLALSWVEEEPLQKMLEVRKAAGVPIADVQMLERYKRGIGQGIKAWTAEMTAELVVAGVEIE